MRLKYRSYYRSRNTITSQFNNSFIALLLNTLTPLAPLDLAIAYPLHNAITHLAP